MSAAKNQRNYASVAAASGSPTRVSFNPSQSAAAAPQGNRPAFNPSTPTQVNRVAVLKGGYGGTGGKSKNKGGEGGLGQRPQELAIEDVARLFQEVNGGFGGTGGEGDFEGGRGGIGQGPAFSQPLVSGMQGRKVPVMAIDKFCRQYSLSKKIHQLLEDEGFETAGALFQVSEGSLKESGFKAGHIAELKRALAEFGAQAQ
ncbi:hypothetical protein K438DRAFT_1941391 [Mycena galopus ATCC 62051]|nr:hypothetical protein K438DRAFT_1941391 [Mycena galopus ATCC 62051]